MRQIVVLLTALSPVIAAAACKDLASTPLPHTTISIAEVEPAGSLAVHGLSAKINNLPAFCRVAGSIHPSTDSDIQFEVWLPEEANWNAKYLGAGNGGFAGSINYQGIASALRRGYATASTDTGHSTGASGIDASWANGHPEKLIDYGYRAIHETTLVAKALVKAYYTKALARSYFSSCSNGGRQALMEAQRYPEDFDGIISGAPANNFTHIAADFVWNAQALAASYIPASKLKAIEAATLAACDAADGVKDGVLDDPRKCKFDPGALLCSGAESDSCLTAGQIETLRKIHAGPGRKVLVGFEPGGETGFGGWAGWITGSAPTKSAQFGFGTQLYANMVYLNKDWESR
jgi:feruloyl esterase